MVPLSSASSAASIGPWPKHECERSYINLTLSSSSLPWFIHSYMSSTNTYRACTRGWALEPPDWMQLWWGRQEARWVTSTQPNGSCHTGALSASGKSTARKDQKLPLEPSWRRNRSSPVGWGDGPCRDFWNQWKVDGPEGWRLEDCQVGYGDIAKQIRIIFHKNGIPPRALFYNQLLSFHDLFWTLFPCQHMQIRFSGFVNESFPGRGCDFFHPSLPDGRAGSFQSFCHYLFILLLPCLWVFP